METAVFYGIHNLVVQNKRLSVAFRDNYALGPRYALNLADAVESFNLFVQTSNRLYVAQLVKRACK